MYTVQDIMRRYNVTQATVLGWISSKQLRAFSVGRRLGAKKPRWRITEQSLRDFELIRMNEPPPAKASRQPQEAGVFYKS